MNLIFVNLTLVADGRMAIPVGFFPISSQTWGFGVTVGKKCQENVKTPWIGLVVFLMQICKKYIFVKKKWSGSINNPKKGNFIKSLKNALHPWKIQTHEKSIPRHHVRNSRPQKKKKTWSWLQSWLHNQFKVEPSTDIFWVYGWLQSFYLMLQKLSYSVRFFGNTS